LEVVGALGFCGPESGVGDLGAEGPVAALAILSGRPDTRSEAIIARSITTLIHQASGAPLWRRPGVSLSPRRHRCTRRTSRQCSSSPCCPRPRPPPARRIYATRRSSRGRCRPPSRWDGGAEARWRQSHDVSGPECVDQRLPDDIGLGVAVYQHDRHDVAVPTVGVAPWLFRCPRSQATACWSTVAACGVCGAGVTPGSSVSACAMSGTTTRSTRAGSS